MVSLLTALVIQSNEISIYPYRSPENQKWGYEIGRIERGNYRPGITCNPIYESKEIAKQEGKDLVDKIRSLDLSRELKELEKIIGEGMPLVQKIASAAQ